MIAATSIFIPVMSLDSANGLSQIAVTLNILQCGQRDIHQKLQADEGGLRMLD
jgi:hypothetical protein